MNTVSNKNSTSIISNQNYSWIGVLEFLQEQYKGSNLKETEWILEKQEMQA